ncbi:alpha/beta hydrolase [Actinoallomurus sp. NPDC052308]|uniref:alpha/beta fold hydrolase n=1 Tax=Actinoallomurus sp. NPDC052308 TaxID=3155530 RepID=UPI003412279D
MDPITTAPAAGGTLRAPDARLYYEVRGEGPLLVLVGAPMAAEAFAPLADLLATGHTVLTTDPRGVGRSPADDPEQDSTPELRAADLARLITHLNAGPAAVLGSSGGAISALALAQSRPELVHTVVAHEPPLAELLDDRDEHRARIEDVIATFASGDRIGGHRRFMASIGITMPEEMFQQMYGGPRDERELAEERRFFLHELRLTVGWRPDVTALRGGTPRLVVGIGAASAGQLCDRTSTALAAGLGVEPVIFPGGHVGFTEDPARFAARLREVLDGAPAA